MRKITILLTTLICFIMQCQAQSKNIEGIWEGKINIGAVIRIVFHISKSADGSYTATMDSPDQNAKGIPVNALTFTGDSIVAEIKSANIFYKGTLVDDTTIDGKFFQGTAALPLVLKHGIVETPDYVRPQTPVPPYSYNSDDVEYDNADKSIHYGATLTYPKTGGSFPTAILITGSGRQDRDETVFGHKPFAVLADYLTKKGYAVLRIDDRQAGKTTGTFVGATSADFAKDIEAGLAYVKARAEVDKNKIGLIGHSEGGVIAPMVAAAHPEIDFIVLWGAPMAGGLRTNVEQNGYSLQKAGINEAAVNAFKQLHTQALGLFATSPDVTKLNTRLKEVFDDWKKQQPDSILKALYVNDSAVVGKPIDDIYDGLYNLVWMRFFITHNFAADLANVHCKVLAINGEKDMQVYASLNLPVIDSILKKDHNRNYKVVPLPGLNHLLQTANTGDVSEYITIQETIAPLALDTIGEWLDGNVKNAKK